jgi:hypothetical protein
MCSTVISIAEDMYCTFSCTFLKKGYFQFSIIHTPHVKMENIYFEECTPNIRDQNPFPNLGFQGTGSGTLFTNLGFQRTGSGILFTTLGFPGIGSGTLFSNLGFHPEPFPGTLQNLGFLRVPEPVPRPVRPEPFSKFSVPGNRSWNPFYKFRVPRNQFWNPFSNLGFFPEPVPRTL